MSVKLSDKQIKSFDDLSSKISETALDLHVYALKAPANKSNFEPNQFAGGQTQQVLLDLKAKGANIDVPGQASLDSLVQKKFQGMQQGMAFGANSWQQLADKIESVLTNASNNEPDATLKAEIIAVKDKLAETLVADLEAYNRSLDAQKQQRFAELVADINNARFRNPLLLGNEAGIANNFAEASVGDSAYVKPLFEPGKSHIFKLEGTNITLFVKDQAVYPSEAAFYESAADFDKKWNKVIELVTQAKGKNEVTFTYSGPGGISLDKLERQIQLAHNHNPPVIASVDEGILKQLAAGPTMWERIRMSVDKSFKPQCDRITEMMTAGNNKILNEMKSDKQAAVELMQKDFPQIIKKLAAVDGGELKRDPEKMTEYLRDIQKGKDALDKLVAKGELTSVEAEAKVKLEGNLKLAVMTLNATLESPMRKSGNLDVDIENLRNKAIGEYDLKNIGGLEVDNNEPSRGVDPLHAVEVNPDNEPAHVISAQNIVEHKISEGDDLDLDEEMEHKYDEDRGSSITLRGPK